MFKRLTNNANAAGAVVAAQNAVTCDRTPLLPDRTCVLEYYGNGITGAAVLTLQGSDDGGTTWSTVRTLSTSEVQSHYFRVEVLLKKTMRMNMTTAAGAGTYTAYLTAAPAP